MQINFMGKPWKEHRFYGNQYVLFVTILILAVLFGYNLATDFTLRHHYRRKKPKNKNAG
jgi:hypothetical protein